MSSNLVSNVTITGNLLVQGLYSNVASLNTGALSTTFLVQGSTTAVSTFKIACGTHHTAVIMANGTVRTFGRNLNGQLGLNDNTERLTPVQVFGISSSATAVACGRYHNAVLLADGTVRTFGDNTYGQLGINVTGGTRQTPVQVFGISSSAVAVASGAYHIAVLLGDGTVRTFGNNQTGQLGVNNTTDSPIPVTVLNITSATAVAGGRYHTAILLVDGTVRTIGWNFYGQLGINLNDGTNRLTPVPVFGISSSATAIACACGSGNHTAVLLADGTVRTFGRNNSGQLGINDTSGTRQTPVQVFSMSSSATAIACGQYHTAVILANGTVRTFGRNLNGQLGVNTTTDSPTPVQVFEISSSATAVAGGRYHTAVLLADGSVRTFGRNNVGQLGVGDTTNRSTPVQVIMGITSVLGRVAGGPAHTAVVMGDGTVRTFGQNSFGKLGVNDNTDRLTPVQVFGISSSATAVACGGNYTAVLLADGTVRTFGRNYAGVLGINVNDGTTRQTPVQVFGISSSATAIAAGGYHTAVLLADGTVRTFGSNDQGQLGINESGASSSRETPVQVFGISSSATAIACGQYHTAVLLADGTVRTFGSSSVGQLGINTSGTQRITPVQVFDISSSATAVSCGARHTAILLADGTVRTFGRNNEGQLGLNDTTDRLTPVQVFGISSSATALSGGFYTTAVLLADGTVRTFGSNPYGQLGVGDTIDRSTPIQVFGISSSATAIASGYRYTVILLADGSVRTVGRNQVGQLGVADKVNRLIPVKVGVSGNKVAAGFYFTAVVSNDGTVRTFGSNQFGQLGINVDGGTRQTPVQITGLTSAIATAGGAVFTAVLLADGTVRTFGRNNNGQLGINVYEGTRQTPVTVVNISRATAVACGSDHGAVLLADGTVRTFGYNVQGQLGIDVDGGSRQTPVQVFGISSSAVSVECGGLYTAVLLADGTVRTFGSNDYGQLGINVTGAGTSSRLTPVQVFGISSSATAVACGYSHTAVLLANGTVRTFGDNSNGKLGIDVTGGTRQTPVQVFGISSSAVAVACGLYSTVVLLADGTVRTFGKNSSGQLGIDVTSGTRQTPVQVFGISSSAVAIAVGGMAYLTAVVLADGTVRTFGSNSQGQLGIGVNGGSRETPVQVVNITTATAIVIPLSSASTPITSFLLSTAAIITYPFIQFPALNLGPVQYPQYQLELTTDYARKLTTSTWTIGSDERLKTDIETANVDRCVDIVQNLDLKRFAWNFPDGSQPPDTHSLGWIAQEFAQFFPNSVNEAPAHGIMDFKNLNSDQIIKVMWGALKKLRADLKSQKSSDSELSTAGDNASPTPE